MPRDSTRNTLLRQWELLKLLPGHEPGKTIKEITETLVGSSFTVGIRQVERDLKDLSAFMPIETQDGKPLRWHWSRGAKRNIVVMSLPEALAWQLVANTVEALLPRSLLVSLQPQFEEARLKLEGLAHQHASANYRDKIRVVTPTLPVIAPVIIPEVLENIQNALLQGNQLEVRYKNFAAETARPMTLHPLGLVLRGPITYLVATLFDYTNIVLLALHRFESAEGLNTPARIPQDFRLDDHINKGMVQFGNGEYLKLEARIDDWLARFLRESPLSEDQLIVPMGKKFRLTATLLDSWQLHWWILSQGNGIEVLQPHTLRENIWESVRQTAKAYAKTERKARDQSTTIAGEDGPQEGLED